MSIIEVPPDGSETGYSHKPSLPRLRWSGPPFVPHAQAKSKRDASAKTLSFSRVSMGSPDSRTGLNACCVTPYHRPLTMVAIGKRLRLDFGCNR